MTNKRRKGECLGTCARTRFMSKSWMTYFTSSSQMCFNCSSETPYVSSAVQTEINKKFVLLNVINRIMSRPAEGKAGTLAASKLCAIILLSHGDKTKAYLVCHQLDLVARACTDVWGVGWCIYCHKSDIYPPQIYFYSMNPNYRHINWVAFHITIRSCNPRNDGGIYNVTTILELYFLCKPQAQLFCTFFSRMLNHT